MATAAQVAVITGAGSGIGRATALRLAAEGWRLALLGRRREPLQEVARLTGGAPLVLPCDISDPSVVEDTAARVLDTFDRVDALINSAGTNIPRRRLEVLSRADYRLLIGTNLDGAFYCVQAFLPAMRRQRSGTIINVSSEAGLQASAKSGAAYVISKFGLAGLTQSINAEERASGVRACCIFPGDVDTPLVSLRPEPPSPDARARMLAPDNVADCIWLALSLPPRAILEQLVVRPR